MGADTEQPARELPRPTPELIALGAVLIALEQELPGITEKVRDLIDGEFLRSKSVVEIRPPKDWPIRSIALELASVWIGRVALAGDAFRGYRRRKKAG